MTTQRWERTFDFPPGHWKKQLPTQYLAVASRGDVAALRQLLTDHPDFLNRRGAHGRTLLWEATRRGKLAAVQWLVEQGAAVDATGAYNNENYVQITSYCAAIYYRRPAVAAYLQTQNPQLDIFRAAFLGDQTRVLHLLDADPSLLNAEDPHDAIYFVPLLAFAVTSGQADLVNLLLARGAVVAPYSAQLIFLAARQARLDLIELLIAHGAELSAVDSGIFITINDLDIMRYLLDHGVSANRLGKNGFPPLIYVARADKAEAPAKVQLLLEYGAAVNAVGPHGRTALHQAARAGHQRVYQLLLQHGADWSLRDEAGKTARESLKQ